MYSCTKVQSLEILAVACVGTHKGLSLDGHRLANGDDRTVGFVYDLVADAAQEGPVYFAAAMGSNDDHFRCLLLS